ncbi:MAG: alpha-L-arabinofuranosidase [Candidatus Poribacteria bacterium]|nr:alpha-L-arabinofuranosidase [Candidatus Poribacteria bacterium]
MSSQIIISSEGAYEDSISPLIFGDFMEPLNDLLPGMWSEKIVDRNFAGVLQPNCIYPPGTNWAYPRWEPIVYGQPDFDRWLDSHGDTEMINVTADLYLDSDNPLTGHLSAKVIVDQNDNRPFIAGIAQNNISVKQGQKLNLEIYLRGSDMKYVPVKVCIGRNYGVFFRSYCQIEFKGVTENWQKFSGTLISEVLDNSAAIVIGIPSKGTFWVDKVSLMPEDNLYGWRPEVVEAIRAMKPGIIRFGGSSLIFYQWQNGIGPREKRSPFENQPWGNMEENDVGLHEFLQFCELVNAEPLICLNSNSATIEQIMDEIEYCNGSADTPYGSIRAEMGHPEPFNVKYWQIGNEQAGEEYERVMVNYASAIRERYPELSLLASYPSDNILLNLSDEVDYVCPHFYAPYTKDRENEIRGLIEKIQKDAKNKNLKLGITEWNHTAGHWGWGRSWLLTLYNALNAGRMFNMYHRLGNVVKIANRSNMTNSCCSGVIQTNQTGDIYFTPCYYVQKAYANLSGDKVLKTHIDENDPLDISATQRGNKVALFVVNYLGQSQSRKINVSDFDISDKLAHSWTLSCNSLDAVNSFQEKNHVAPVESMIEFKGKTFEYEFPAYSVTVIHFNG